MELLLEIVLTISLSFMFSFVFTKLIFMSSAADDFENHESAFKSCRDLILDRAAINEQYFGARSSSSDGKRSEGKVQCIRQITEVDGFQGLSFQEQADSEESANEEHSEGITGDGDCEDELFEESRESSGACEIEIESVEDEPRGRKSEEEVDLLDPEDDRGIVMDDWEAIERRDFEDGDDLVEIWNAKQ
ncbi:hypothetical protein Nepgr_008211 [Nepenthes gracilis]|uniref:Uncharacterized protein n=1 Tax=Nepenthes gracilis TaxID=150966 RepID=A0AAD3S8M9_NEPGR|nr:hypothetical protein Nepgr_008211 [Nepenthes gracilis]